MAQLHLLEILWCRSFQAVLKIGNYFLGYRTPEHLEGPGIARQNMQMAAFYAGRAFTRGCVGYVHAIGHTLGSLYGIDHGTAMAVLLPRVMGAFGSAAHRRLAELAEVCGMEGTTEEEKAAAFLRWIETTNRDLGLPERFPMIRGEDIPRMIRWARKEAHPLYAVPVIWTEDNFRSLIESLRK